VHWGDLVRFAISALWQQKVRTLLTLLGVIFGSFVLTASLSIGQGVQNAIAKIAKENEALRLVRAMPEWMPSVPNEKADEPKVKGEMSETRRARLQRVLTQFEAATSGRGQRVKLTEKTIAELRAIPHVASVIPHAFLNGFAVLGDRSSQTTVNAVRPADKKGIARLAAGRFPDTADEPVAVVSEFLLYRMGIENEADDAGVLGQKLSLEFHPETNTTGLRIYAQHPQGKQSTREEAAVLEEIKRQLPKVIEQLNLKPEQLAALGSLIKQPEEEPQGLYLQEFTIVGVTRAPTEEEERDWEANSLAGGVLLPYETAAKLYFNVPGMRDEGVNEASILVDEESNVKEVLGEVRKVGLRGMALLEFIEREKLLYLMIFGGMTCVAAVAMLVAALGIANTMLISVLERTREIGIMKAVGARSGQLQAIFLVEGALIGAIGGGLGLLFAWASSFPGDAWVRRMATRDLNVDLKESIFVFPPWLVMSVVGAATLVTVLAAVYPARRAARLDPVTALRHE
jgi:putative ABC transport system permease protein